MLPFHTCGMLKVIPWNTQYACITKAYNMACGVVDTKADEPESVVQVASATTATTTTTAPLPPISPPIIPPHTPYTRNCRCGIQAFAVNCDRKLCKHDCVTLGGCSLSGHGGTRPLTRPRTSLGSSTARPSRWRRASCPPIPGASAGEEDTCVVLVQDVINTCAPSRFKICTPF
jgi:hypothetical protein